LGPTKKYIYAAMRYLFFPEVDNIGDTLLTNKRRKKYVTKSKCSTVA